MKPSKNSVPVGWSSIIGWIAALGALAVCVAQSLEEAQPLLTGHNKTAGIISAVILIATHAGRQYQGKPGTTVIEAAPAPAPEPQMWPPSMGVASIPPAADPAPSTPVEPPLPPPAAAA